MLLEIITAESQVYGDDVDMVVAPGVDGQLGILPHHAPLMTMLQPGEILVRKDGADTFMAVTGGFMEVIGNKVTILADAAERADDIDEAEPRRRCKGPKNALPARRPTWRWSARWAPCVAPK
jgi:F-type H+-transporting ATPase subunit epsilon